MSDLVRIWPFEHDAWWRANSPGYASNEEGAGLYPRAKAEEICRQTNDGGRLYEEVVELVLPPLKERIAALIRKIIAQNNRTTASPYYFSVKSERSVGTVHDGEKEVVAVDGQLDTLLEWVESDPEATRASWEAAEPFWVRAEWEDKAVFLTKKEALKFIGANAHHLTEPRTYVKRFWRN